MLNGWEPQSLSHFRQSLRRDGHQVDEQTRQITPVGPQLSIESIARLADPSTIREGFARIRRAIGDDPALAVGSAKELIESTAKVVLTERGQPFDDKSDLPKLARAAQLSLGLDPLDRIRAGRQRWRQAHPRCGRNHRQWTRRVAQSGLGTGHGPATARVGLGSRHAHLAVNAALTWCQPFSTPSPTPKRPGAKVTRKPRLKLKLNEGHENNQFRSVAKPTRIPRARYAAD